METNFLVPTIVRHFFLLFAVQTGPDVEVAGQFFEGGAGGGVKWAGSGWVVGRVKFPPFAWKLLTVATQPPPIAGRGPIHSTDAAL